MPSSEGYVGLLSFGSFVFSVIAAVLAIDLYALFRTGRSGATWRVLIIASVMFALMQALRLGAVLSAGAFRLSQLSEIVELMFVMALAYAFYLQRQAFGPRERRSPRSALRPTPRSSEKASLPPQSRQNTQDLAGAPQSHHEDPDSALTSAEDDQDDQDDSSEDEEDAASEWARLNGQSDSPRLNKAGRVGE